MKRITIILIFIYCGILNAQERKVKKALSYLEEQKFEQCIKLSKEIEIEYPDLPLSYFINFRYFSNDNNPNFSLIKSFENINKVEIILEKNQAKAEWCKNFSLCSDKILTYKDSIANLALKEVIKDKSKQKFIEYLNFYKNTPSTVKCFDQYSEWCYSKIYNTSLIVNFENFITEFPNTKETILAKDKIIEIEYESCLKRNEVSCLEFFIQKNPNSKYINKVKNRIEELDFERCGNESSSLEKFIQKYPTSKFVNDAKNIIEKNDFYTVEMSDNKEYLISFLNKYPNSIHTNIIKNKIKDLNSESIIVSENGVNREDAISKCLINSIELISLNYISSETFISNEKLIKESIKKISTGEILRYQILNEEKIDESNYEVTLKSNVRIDTLSSFFKSQGLDLIFDRSTFKYKINYQKNKENQEIKVLYDVIGKMCENFQKSFDYKLSTSTPVNSGLNDFDWRIPLNVSVTKNSIFTSNYKFLINILKQLSIPDKELDDYKKYKKNIYNVSINSQSGDSIFYLRNRNSLRLIDLFFNNYLNYTSSFNIISEVDSLNGLNIYSESNNFYYLTNHEKTSYNDVNSRVKIEYSVPIISEYEKDYSKFGDATPIKEIKLNNLLEIDTLAKFKLNLLVKLEDLKKIKSFNINSNGKQFYYRNKCLEYMNFNSIYNIKLKFMINYFNQVEQTSMDTIFQFYPFTASNLHVADEFEISNLFLNPFHKLLPIPKGSHWINYKGEDCIQHTFPYDENKKGFHIMVYHEDKIYRTLDTRCFPYYKLNNVIILKR